MSPLCFLPARRSLRRIALVGSLPAALASATPTAIITSVNSGVVEQGPFPNLNGGALGPARLEFTISLSEPAPANCRFEYSFGSTESYQSPLTPGKDIVWEFSPSHPRPGLIEIPPGVTTASFSWLIQPDGFQEPDSEWAKLNFHNPRNLTLAISSITTRVTDDDGPVFIQALATGKHRLTTGEIEDAGVRYFLHSLNGLNSAHATNRPLNASAIVPGRQPDSTLHLGSYVEGTHLGDQFTGSGPGNTGISAAVGDVTGDGVPDAVFGSAPGLRSLVVVVNTVTNQQITQFQPYGDFSGGVHVAIGDVNGDGRADIITGPGSGGGPHLRAFDLGPVVANTGPAGLLRDFFLPHAPTFTGGIRVASGDVDRDGYDDIISGFGPGGDPEAGVYSGRLSGLNNVGGPPLFITTAYGADFRGGVWVASGDYDRDGFADIVTGAGEGGGPHVRVISPHLNTPLDGFFVPAPSNIYPGVKVGNVPFEQQGFGFTSRPTFFMAQAPTYGKAIYHERNGTDLAMGRDASTGIGFAGPGVYYAPFSIASIGASPEPAWPALPPAALPVLSLTKSALGLELRISTEQGAFYDLETSTDLRSWQRADSYIGDGLDRVINVSPLNGSPRSRFFRAVTTSHRY